MQENPYQAPLRLEEAEGVNRSAAEQALTTLRFFVVAEMVLTGAVLGVDWWLFRWLPPMRLDENFELKEIFSPAPVMVDILGLPVMALMAMAWFGVLLAWRPARLLYLISIISSCGLQLLGQPKVIHPWCAAVEYAAVLTSGLVLAMLYFSPAKQAFERVRGNSG